MPPSECSLRLQYLKESADFLVSQSPSTSAHLLAVHNQILHEDFKPLNKRQHETACGACGSIRKPEWTKTTQVKRKTKGKRSKKQTAKDAPVDATVFKCLRCHRKTVKPRRQEIVRTNPSSRTTTPTVQQSATAAGPSTSGKDPLQGTGTSENVQESKAAENASSKKRAKARKQGGLQALLASKQRSQADSSSSLGLFDFLQ